MPLIEMLSQASLFALLSLAVGVLPIAFGAAYALWPSESKLALLRPISLAAIFAGLSGTILGIINALSPLWLRSESVNTTLLAVGGAEALVPMFVAFASLTIAWLCAAVGLHRHT